MGSAEAPRSALPAQHEKSLCVADYGDKIMMVGAGAGGKTRPKEKLVELKVSVGAGAALGRDRLGEAED